MPKPKPDACPHPVAEQVTIGFGVFCQLCKLRVRLLTPKEGNAKIMRDIKMVATGQ